MWVQRRMQVPWNLFSPSRPAPSPPYGITTGPWLRPYKLTSHRALPPTPQPTTSGFCQSRLHSIYEPVPFPPAGSHALCSGRRKDPLLIYLPQWLSPPTSAPVHCPLGRPVPHHLPHLAFQALRIEYQPPKCGLPVGSVPSPPRS